MFLTWQSVFTHLPLASGESFWLFMGLCLAIWAVIAAVGKTCEDSRGQSAAMQRKRCRHCQTEHPGFAAFCRHCGRRF